MKTNLKTFQSLINVSRKDIIRKVLEWKEDFEAEQKEINKIIQKEQLDSKSVSDMETQYWRGYNQRGREVLGIGKRVTFLERIQNKEILGET